MKAIKLFAITLTGVLLYTGCASEKSKEAKAGEENPAITETKAILVRTVAIENVSISRTLDNTATLQPFEEVNIAPAAPGRIEKIYVEPGDRVKKGDRLFLMDQTQLKQTEIQLNSLKVDLNRMSTLLETGSITQSAYDQLKTTYDVTESSLLFMKENTLLFAPFNGVITGKYYENGEMFSGAPNTPAGKAAVVTLMQTDPLKAVVNVSENYYPSVKNGMKASIKSDVYEEREFDGSVILVYPTINPVSRSFQVEVKVPNSDNSLKPGMFARVAMILGEDGAVIVPANTVLQQEGTNIRYIFVEENGIAKRINVAIGKRFDERIEIISDMIEIGDRLIVDGQTKLEDGDKVKVVN